MIVPVDGVEAKLTLCMDGVEGDVMKDMTQWVLVSPVSLDVVGLFESRGAASAWRSRWDMTNYKVKAVAE